MTADGSDRDGGGEQARELQQSVLSELGLRALAEDDLDSLFGNVVERVASTLGVPICAILERSPEGVLGVLAQEGALDPADTGELAELAELQREWPPGQGKHPEDAVPAWIRPDFGLERWPTGEIRLATRLAAVIYGRQRPFGLVLVVSLEPRSFSRDDQTFLNGVAGLLAAAVERRRVERQRAELEAQLWQRQRLDALGTLASGVAHEINNPIQGIMSYAELISVSAPVDSRLKTWAEAIVQGAERIAVIVRTLLAFARPEAASRQAVAMRGVVNKTLSLVRTVLRKDQITLEVELPEALPLVECHSQQIQQVLMNLIVNARDALNARYPDFHENKRAMIRARAFERQHQRWLRMTVEDWGVGIPEEHLERIFDPFFTTKRGDQSLGLGLSVSHAIVTQHGGRLWAESLLGRFTRLHVELPAQARA